MLQGRLTSHNHYHYQCVSLYCHFLTYLLLLILYIFFILFKLLPFWLAFLVLLSLLKFRSFGDSWSSKVQNKLKTIRWVAGILSKRDLQYSILEWMREVETVQTVVWSIVIRIRIRTRISLRQDLETAKICWTNDRFSSKITPRLRAESTGENMTLLGKWMVGVLSVYSCWGVVQRWQTQF